MNTMDIALKLLGDDGIVNLLEKLIGKVGNKDNSIIPFIKLLVEMESEDGTVKVRDVIKKLVEEEKSLFNFGDD